MNQFQIESQRKGRVQMKVPAWNLAVKHRALIATLLLGIAGLTLIVVAQTFQFNFRKISIDKLTAEVGALLLVVAVLHWIFELGLRREMVRAIAETVSNSATLHVSGLEACYINSREIKETDHWSHAANLTVGRLYSTRLLKDFNGTFKYRCKHNRPTKIIVLNPKSKAANYIEESGAGISSIEQSLKETQNLIIDIQKEGEGKVQLLLHDRALRYSFIKTDEWIWVTFFTNSDGRSDVPALKFRADTPLFKFFDDDTKRLLEASHEPD